MKSDDNAVELDREQLRRAYKQYLQWNEADLAGLPSDCDILSPAQARHEYLPKMVSLDWDALPESTDWRSVEKLAELDHWYACVFRLEAWRRKHGKARP